MKLLGEALVHQNTETPKGKKGAAPAKKEEAKDQEVSETCMLKQFEEFHRNTHHQGGTEGQDSDEEGDDDGHGHGHGGQRVGCQSQ